jgi:hypothetical protein
MPAKRKPIEVPFAPPQGGTGSPPPRPDLPQALIAAATRPGSYFAGVDGLGVVRFAVAAVWPGWVELLGLPGGLPVLVETPDRLVMKCPHGVQVRHSAVRWVALEATR